MVDGVLLPLPARPELERRDTDRECAEARDNTPPRSGHVLYDGCGLEEGEIGIASLCADPALVRLERRPVRHRLLRAAPAFLDVELEIGEREQVRARVEDELREIRRSLARDRRDG